MSGGVISEEDFNLLQEQLIELKRYKYEATEREKKLQTEQYLLILITELKSQKDHIESLENENTPKKKGFSLSGIMSQKNKVSDLTEENDSLKKSLQQIQQDHQTQSEALKHNIKSLFETNKQLEDEILLLKKEMQSYVIKVEDQQSTNRRLQVEIAELICSKEDLENKVEELKTSGGGAGVGVGGSDGHMIIGENGADNTTVATTLEANGALTAVTELITQHQQSNQQLFDKQNIMNLLDNVDLWSIEDKEDIKSKIDEIYNEIHLKLDEQQQQVQEQQQLLQVQQQQQQAQVQQQVQQQQQQKNKSVVFHPLGEPVVNVEEEKEKSKLRETIKGLMEQIKEIDSKSQRQQNESKEYQQSIETLNTTIKEYQEKLLGAEVNRVKIEEKLASDIKKLTVDINTLNSDIETMSNKRKDLENTISNLNSQVMMEKETINQLQNQLKDQKTFYESKVSDSNDQSNIFKMARDEYAQTLRTVTDDLAIKDKLIESKGEEILQLKETIAGLESDLEKRSSELRETLSASESINTQMKKADEKLSRERSTLDSLTERYNKLNSEFEESDKHCKSLTQQIVETNEKLQLAEQAKQDLQSTNTKLNEDTAKLQSDLQERVEQLEKLESSLDDANKRLAEFDELNQTYNEAREQIEELEASNANLQLIVPQLDKLKADYEEASAKVSKLETALADAETEKKIAEKKTNKMIKDLKSELSKERTSVNLLSQSSGSIPTTPNSSPLMSQSANSISLPTTPLQTPGRTGHLRTMSQGIPLSSSSGQSTPKSLTPNITMLGASHNSSGGRDLNGSGSNSGATRSNNNKDASIDSLRMDIEVMGRKLGELGTEKYKLEEKIRALEENVLLLNQDIEKKNKVVRFYISKTQLGKATTNDEKSRRLKGGALGSFWRNNDPTLVAEMVEKMETMLQEYILKNIQLSDDVEILGNEASRLTSENKTIKILLKDNNIPIPEPPLSPTYQASNTIENNINTIEIKCKYYQRCLSEEKDIWRERQKYFTWSTLYKSPRTMVYFGFYDMLVGTDRLLLKHHLRLKNEKQGYFTSIAASQGHTNILKLLYSLTTSDTFDFVFDGNEIVCAARCGHFDCVVYLYQNAKQLKQCGAMVEALLSAASSGHIEILQYLLPRLVSNGQCGKYNDSLVEIAIVDNDNQIVKKRKNGHIINRSEVDPSIYLSLMEAASKGGHLDLLIWLAKDRESDVKSNGNSLSIAAATKGHLRILEWLHSIGVNKCSSSALYGAAMEGHLEVIKWLFDNDALSNQPKISNAVSQALWNEHNHIADWLLANKKLDIISSGLLESLAKDGKLEQLKRLVGVDYFTLTAKALNQAAMNGNINTVKWLNEVMVCPISASAIDRAAKNGHLNVIEYLVKSGKDKCTSLALTDAAHNGHFETVKFLHEQLHCTTNIKKAFEAAASAGHLKIIVYFTVEKKLHTDWQFVIRVAVKAGYVDVVEYISNNNLIEFSQCMHDKAAKHGQLPMVKWLHHHKGSIGFSKKAINLAAANRHYDIVRFLCENRTEGFSAEAICYVCGQGSIEMLEYLMPRLEDPKELRPNNPFDFACIKGHLDVVERLFQYGDLIECSATAVDTSSIAGHFKILMYLMEQRNIQGTTDALDFAASNGYKEIVEYLHNHKAACTKSALKKAAKNNHFAVVQFLCENRTEVGKTFSTLKFSEDPITLSNFMLYTIVPIMGLGLFFKLKNNNNVQKKRVVIVGGGYGGVILAGQLDKKYDVVMIERNKSFFHYISAMRCTTNPELSKKCFFEYDKVMKHGKIIHASVTKVQPDRVTIENGDEFNFDYMVIATGANNITPFKAPSDSSNIYQYYQGLKDKIQQSKKILIIGGGAVGVELAAEIATDFKEKQITLVSRSNYLISPQSTEVFMTKLQDKLKQLNINVLLNTTIDTPDDILEARRKQEIFDYQVKRQVYQSNSGEIEADLVFWAIGNKLNNELLNEFPLDSKGYLRVNKHLQIEGFDNIFGIGDITNIQERRTVRNTMNQSATIIKNIDALSNNNKTLHEYKPTAFSVALVLGRNEGIAMFPNGWFLPDWLCRMLSKGGMGINTTIKLLGKPANASIGN
ncbi:hypothetical protein PPL_04583 [Heterostelium album PN500]|uniref:FAD/NAD(P)-binding domain-containing protein n=1 Tax=Heterostelium pallidum (strain ATCC 26659 / Pp 5 / PN500) TaxID=670386 RepID=D3B7Z5_HETP5|nr:hypothetical protein PPL_04583 [Heterostelium album PN500]EFA82163.1 hypothetical protein PPL_04583 [Heterostelium album PN500]|eukprot:XP_020434280.1 hypothetical protein PPL_04583 [Heterostelium album PN500]